MASVRKATRKSKTPAPKRSAAPVLRAGPRPSDTALRPDAPVLAVEHFLQSLVAYTEAIAGQLRCAADPLLSPDVAKMRINCMALRHALAGVGAFPGQFDPKYWTGYRNGYGMSAVTMLSFLHHDRALADFYRQIAGLLLRVEAYCKKPCAASRVRSLANTWQETTALLAESAAQTVEKVRELVSRTVAVPPDGGAPPVLREDSQAILRFLAAQTTYTKQHAIAVAVRRNDSTVNDRLQELRQYGYTTKNRRTGEVITSNGLAYLRSLPV